MEYLAALACANPHNRQYMRGAGVLTKIEASFGWNQREANGKTPSSIRSIRAKCLEMLFISLPLLCDIDPSGLDSLGLLPGSVASALFSSIFRLRRDRDLTSTRKGSPGELFGLGLIRRSPTYGSLVLQWLASYRSYKAGFGSSERAYEMLEWALEYFSGTIK